jgi:hypothetical protein
MNPDEILCSVEEKWREYLEMLPSQEEKVSVMANILATMLHKQQLENTYLRRRLRMQCIPK